MKVCKELLTGTQVVNYDGIVRLCCHLYHDVGKLSENTLDEIWNGEETKYVFGKLAAGDYSLCYAESCPYLTSGKTPPLVEIDDIPPHPTHLNLSYEFTCNYRCSVCFINDVHDTEKAKHELIMDRVEKNLESALPRLKYLAANGAGELFVSKRTMRLLSSWKPVSPPEEVSVFLATNGSLFDEQHWKQIENLGQYNVRVTVTVMSFDEHTYQVLSGVKYPISRVENSLRFIKSLREKGLVNRFEIATVVQERNFRTLPTFVKRCIEEFGVDGIRLRPYARILNVPFEEDWFTNVRIKQHPYHKEYLEILKDPILKHPKVMDWGIFNSLDVKFPLNDERKARQKEIKVLQEIFTNDSFLKNIKNILPNGKNIIIHGVGSLGMALVKSFLEDGAVKVDHITDFKQKGEFLNVPIVNINDRDSYSRAEYDKTLPILVTWLETEQRHLDYIRNLGYTGKFIKLEDIFDFDKLFKEDCDCCK